MLAGVPAGWDRPARWNPDADKFDPWGSQIPLRRPQPGGAAWPARRARCASGGAVMGGGLAGRRIRRPVPRALGRTGDGRPVKILTTRRRAYASIPSATPPSSASRPAPNAMGNHRGGGRTLRRQRRLRQPGREGLTRARRTPPVPMSWQRQDRLLCHVHQQRRAAPSAVLASPSGLCRREAWIRGRGAGMDPVEFRRKNAMRRRHDRHRPGAARLGLLTSGAGRE